MPHGGLHVTPDPGMVDPTLPQKTSTWARSRAVRGAIAVAAVLGVVLMIVGIVWFFLEPYGLQDVVLKQVLVTGTDSPRYAEWQSMNSNPPVKSFYLFNLTNPTEYVAGTAPVLNLLGPYQYQMQFERLAPAFSGDKVSVSYQETTRYVWVESQTMSPLDLVTMVNPYYMSYITAKGGENAVFQKLLQPVLTQIYNKLVAEFNSTTDALLQWGSLNITGVNGPSDTEIYCPPCGRNVTFDYDISQEILTGTYGLTTDNTGNLIPIVLNYLQQGSLTGLQTFWPTLTAEQMGALASYLPFVMQNAVVPYVESLYFNDDSSGLVITRPVSQWLFETPEGLVQDYAPAWPLYLISNDNNLGDAAIEANRSASIQTTGVNNIPGTQVLTQWEGVVQTPSAPTAQVGGTEGYQFSPLISGTPNLTLWLKEAVCQTTLTYDSEEAYAAAPHISLLRYKLGSSNFDASNMIVNGVINLGSQAGRIGFGLSKPNFLGGESSLAAAVGVKSSHSDDESYFDVEPMTGQVFAQNLRLQVNVQVNANLTTLLFPSVYSATMPLVIMNTTWTASSADTTWFSNTVVDRRETWVALGVLLLALAFLFLAVAATCAWRVRKVLRTESAAESARLIPKNQGGY